jgi:hypothetical protein
VSDGVPINVGCWLIGHQQITTTLNRYRNDTRGYEDLRVRRVFDALDPRDLLGASCGLSASAISSLEIGARAPNILTLRRVAAGLAVPLPTLVDESNDPFRPKHWAGSDSRPAPRRR